MQTCNKISKCILTDLLFYQKIQIETKKLHRTMAVKHETVNSLVDEFFPPVGLGEQNTQILNLLTHLNFFYHLAILVSLCYQK